MDAPSVELARENAAAAGVADPVRFHLAGGYSLESVGSFDGAFAFEYVHDMSQPVDVLHAMHRSVREDGIVVVMDEAVGGTFGGPGAEFEPLMYAFSFFRFYELLSSSTR